MPDRKRDTKAFDKSEGSDIYFRDLCQISGDETDSILNLDFGLSEAKPQASMSAVKDSQSTMQQVKKRRGRKAKDI